MKRETGRAGNRKTTSRRGTGDQRLYTLKVSALSGPMTGRFVRKNPVVSRTIQIRGDQTLADLHGAIFDAFDREEEHMYEFQVGGRGPMDPSARRYVLPTAMDAPCVPRGKLPKVTERVGQSPPQYVDWDEEA